MMRIQPLILGLCALTVTAPVLANGMFKAKLTGFEEVPAISSPGSGTAEVRVAASTIQYTLQYRDLDSGVLFAHIHFGQAGTNGGISVFLCSNVSIPECPESAGTVSGVLTAADVIGPGGQGIEPGEFDELVDAIRAGATYVNVHSNDFPGGEIRGQLGRGSGPK